MEVTSSFTAPRIIVEDQNSAIQLFSWDLENLRSVCPASVFPQDWKAVVKEATGSNWLLELRAWLLSLWGRDQRGRHYCAFSWVKRGAK